MYSGIDSDSVQDCWDLGFKVQGSRFKVCLTELHTAMMNGNFGSLAVGCRRSEHLINCKIGKFYSLLMRGEVSSADAGLRLLTLVAGAV